MLPLDYKPINFDKPFEKEPWEAYLTRIGLTDSRPEREFFRQVVYDHFDHFNYHYPCFVLSGYRLSMIQLTVNQVEQQIRYFHNDKITDEWKLQFDEFLKVDYQYLVFQRMKNDGTPPFPPVLIDSSKLIDDTWVYGRPLHLIEGTHRTSYLVRMAELGMIAWDSEHDFVLLQPR